MANTIALASKFLPILDGLYKKYSLTAILDTPEDRVMFEGANQAKVFVMELDGDGDYSRANGYAEGEEVGSWEPLTMKYDRGRSFNVDAMDNEETLGMAAGALAGEYQRVHAVPETDAIRFAEYAQGAGTVVKTAIDAQTSVVALIDDAEATLGDAEVPEGSILFVSEKAYKGLKNGITRMVLNDVTGVQRNVEVYDNMPVVRVPQNRFYSLVTLLDGRTEGQKNGGTTPKLADNQKFSGNGSTKTFTVTAKPASIDLVTVGGTATEVTYNAETGVVTFATAPANGTDNVVVYYNGAHKINFMIVNPTALAQVIKHNPTKVFSPAENQDADAWKFQFRRYHTVEVLKNKKLGIYVSLDPEVKK